MESTRTGRADRRPHCIFCRIVAGQAPVSPVFDAEGVLAFMDVNPVRPGHLLVIPTAHRAQIWEMRDEEFASVYRHLPTLVRALKRAMDADAIDVLNLNGPGLMGLFRRERLPVSGDRVSDERVRRQIRQGSGAMPPHGHLSDADVAALVEYLRTL